VIHRERCIIIDVDGTLCAKKKPDESYDAVEPIPAVIERLREYKSSGFHVILATSRNMNTYDGNIGLITANTDFGKPWAGKGGFYVDDKAVRPDEFLKLNYGEILALVGSD
jgi:hydroxymethylpyrimidine pyrophosphatase-like HAD family hydrolase